MTNPFENDNYTYKVLINEEGQYSLWPAFLDVPIGRNIVYEEASRQSCLEYVEYNWKDLNPKSNQVREKNISRKTIMKEKLNPKVVVSIVYITAMFMAAMDATIVNVALQTISRELQVPASAMGTVNVGYLVSLAVFLPISGWLGDRFGTKRVFLIALFVFTIASALCGMANDITSLNIFRIIQGVWWRAFNTSWNGNVISNIFTRGKTEDFSVHYTSSCCSTEQLVLSSVVSL